MITVQGACRILAPLVAEATEASFSRPSSLVTKTNRAGEQLALVGPMRARS